VSRFVFGIPLRSRQTARDWDQVSHLFEATLNSVLAQSDPDFSVIVACHERPTAIGFTDPRVVTIELPPRPIVGSAEQMKDKGLKHMCIGAALRRMGGGFLMFVDADDLVSNRIVAYVRRHPDPHGYIVDAGYEYDCATGLVRMAPRFDRLCGSCAVFNYALTDLPETPHSTAPCRFTSFSNHSHWRDIANTQGRPLAPLPFRAVVFVRNNGENHSIATGNIGWRRRLLRTVLPSRRPSLGFCREFGLACGISQPSRGGGSHAAASRPT
jgi:hypothetical protein